MKISITNKNDEVFHLEVASGEIGGNSTFKRMLLKGGQAILVLSVTGYVMSKLEDKYLKREE